MQQNTLCEYILKIYGRKTMDNKKVFLEKNQ